MAWTTNHATWPMLSRNRAGVPAMSEVRENARGNRERRTVAVLMSVPCSEPHTDGGEHDVDCEQCDHAQHQGLVHRGTDTLGATGHRQAPVAADESGDQAE